MEKELDRPSTAQVPPKYRPSTAQVEKLVAVMNDDYLDVSELMKLCSIVRRKTMHDSYIAPALADGSIERKYPEQPNHPKQMYRLTEKAKIWKKLDVFWLKMKIMLNNRTWLALPTEKGADIQRQSIVLDISIGEWEEHVFLLEI